MLLSTVASFPVGFTRYMNPVRHTPHKETGKHVEIICTVVTRACIRSQPKIMAKRNDVVYGELRERRATARRTVVRARGVSQSCQCCSAEISQKCTARSMVASRNQRTYDLSAVFGRALLQLPILLENHCQSLPSHADRHRNFDLSQRKLVLCRWKRCLRLGLSWICASLRRQRQLRFQSA